MLSTVFILGREPELSVAELEARSKGWSATVDVLSPHAALLLHPEPLPERMLNRLGGSIKQVDVVERWPIELSIAKTMMARYTGDWLLGLFPGDGRVEFGASFYDAKPVDRAGVAKLSLSHKKEIAQTDRAVRFVTSKEDQLSAVTVQRNGLLKKGKEIVFILRPDEILVGVTRAVQDYQLYGLRDFGRPAANAKSGMLPPKLAQMMLNIAGVQSGDLLLDPFCGTGTVLQEAALMGVKKIFGSDLEARAVKDSQENMSWLFREFPDLHTDVEIILRDARQISATADVIVTEPYLGKPLRGHEPKDWLEEQARDLTRLYLQAFQQWKKHLRPGGRIVMVWPEFTVGGADVTINLDKAIQGLGFALQPLLKPSSAAAFVLPDASVLRYGRDDAKVQRQIRRWTLRSK